MRPTPTSSPTLPAPRRGPRAESGRLLVVVLAAIVVAVVSAGVLTVVADRGDELPERDPDGTRTELPVPGRGSRPQDRVHSGVDPEQPELDDTDDVIYLPRGTREPHGDVFTVDDESLRAVLADRHWEEIRRQIEVLQRNGGEVPEDVLLALIGMLEASDTRIDAVLALGGVDSEAAGRLLAERATGESHSMELRMAALDALARSGNAAAQAQVIALLTTEGTDPRLVRRGAAALAAMGGDESARALTSVLLAMSPDAPERDAVITALGKTPSAGTVLADTLRSARENGDGALASKVMKVALIQGTDASAELRAAVRSVLDDQVSMDADMSDVEQRDRLRLRSSALAAAAAMGGDLLDVVVGIAESDTDGLGGVALHSLRRARGDDAAVKIGAAALRATGDRARRELVEALGETRSRKATATLLRLLDDSSAAVRRASAKGLVLIRDPASVKTILERLDDAKDDFPLARSYAEALGTIGDRRALDRLNVLSESQEGAWKDANQWVRRAIHRIESGNPESMRMK